MALGKLGSLVRKCLRGHWDDRFHNPKTTMSFFLLPPEIRNLILEQVYDGEGQACKVTSNRLAVTSQKGRQCTVDRLLVSKQWFYETVPTFSSNTLFEFSSFADLAYVARRLPTYVSDHITSVSWHTEHLRRLELDKDDVAKISEVLPKLRDVRVHVNSMLMIQKSTNYRKAITRDRLDASDFAMCHGVDALRSFRGLKDFQWVETEDVSALRRYYAADRMSIWARNLAAFERYILAEASKARS